MRYPHSVGADKSIISPRETPTDYYKNEVILITVCTAEVHIFWSKQWSVKNSLSFLTEPSSNLI